MNLSQLDYFIAAAHSNSFARAAESLYVTPQTISTAVSALEKEWGFPLFIRKKKTLRLTEAGAAMLAAAEKVAGSVKELEEKAASLRNDERSSLTFVYASASLPQSGEGLTLDLLARFEQENPDTALGVFQMTSDACINAVQQHRADLAFAPAYALPADLEGIQVGYGTYLVGMSRDNPLASREAVSFADLKGFEIFPPPDLGPSYAGIVDHCRAYGFTPRFSDAPFGSENARRYTAENRGVSLTPRFLAESREPSDEERIVFLPLIPEDEYGLPLRLVWRKGDAKPRRLRDFIVAHVKQPEG